MLVCTHCLHARSDTGLGLHTLSPTSPVLYLALLNPTQSNSWPLRTLLSLIPVNLRHCPKTIGASSTGHPGLGKQGDSGTAVLQFGQKRSFSHNLLGQFLNPHPRQCPTVFKTMGKRKHCLYSRIPYGICPLPTLGWGGGRAVFL